MKLSVVIPARNEAGNLGGTLDALRDRLRREGISYELVVVDDGSTDATAEEARARSADDPGVRLVRNTGPLGFGYAVRCGLDAMTGDAVVVYMADASDSPEDLVRYYYVLRDRAECAFGSRFLPESQVVDYPRGKLVVNRLANLFIRLLFRFRYDDVTNAFKGYRATVIEGCRPLIAPHFSLTVELPLKAIVRGYSYEVLPIGWRQRRVGASRLRLEEMGSRYLFIVLYAWLERLLTRGDYRRPVQDRFRPWPRAAGDPTTPSPRLGEGPGDTVRAVAGGGRRWPAGAFWPVLALTLLVYLGTTLPGLAVHPIPFGDEPWLMEVGYQAAVHQRLANPMLAYVGHGITEHRHGDDLYVYYLYLAGVLKIFGFGLFQARLASVLSGTLLLIGLALLGRSLFAPAVGNVAALLLALDNHFLGNSRLVKGHVLAAALAVWAFWLLWLALRGRSTTLWLATGVLFGLALTAHVKAWHVLPFLAVALLAAWTRGRLSLRAGVALAVGLGLVLAPVAAYVASSFPDFLGQWAAQVYEFQQAFGGLTDVLAGWDIGLYNGLGGNPSPVTPHALTGFVVLVVAGAGWLVREVTRGGAYQVRAGYLLLAALAAAVSLVAGVRGREIRDLVYLSPWLAVVGAVPVLPAVPGREGGRAGPTRWLSLGARVLLAAYVTTGLIQCAAYASWNARSDAPPLTELAATLRRLVPRDARILGPATQWPLFHDYPTFYAAELPIEGRVLSVDLASGKLGDLRYDTLIIDDQWRAAAWSTTPTLLTNFEAALTPSAPIAVLHNTRLGEVHVHAIDGSRRPWLAEPLRVFFAREQPGIFQMGVKIEHYRPVDVVRAAVRQVPGVRVSAVEDGVRILSDHSNYHYQLALPLPLRPGRAYAVRVSLRVVRGGVLLGIENRGAWVVGAVAVGPSAGITRRDIGAVLHRGGRTSLLIANNVAPAPGESEMLVRSIELWELRPWTPGAP